MKFTKLNLAAFAIILGLTAGLGACDNAGTDTTDEEAPALESPAAPGMEPGVEESPLISPTTSP